jgi:hypothetical protein
MPSFQEGHAYTPRGAARTTRSANRPIRMTNDFMRALTFFFPSIVVTPHSGA